MLGKWRSIKAFAARLFHLLESNNALATDSNRMLKEIMVLSRETQNLVLHHDRLLQRSLAAHDSSLSNQISLMEAQLELLKLLRNRQTEGTAPEQKGDKYNPQGDASQPASDPTVFQHSTPFNAISLD
jgi:hypothetical protein